MTFLDMFEYVSEKEKAETKNTMINKIEEKPETEEKPEEIEENENFEMNEEE